MMRQASLAPIRPKTCCFRSALDRNATFCEECGQPILRCMASEECGGLLDESWRCPVCVAPELSLDAGAGASVKVGGTLALPLLVTNTSPVGRPLFIEAMWISGKDGEQREVDLAFHRLNPGDSADISVRTGPLDTAGIHRIDVFFVAATRYLWREERYVFKTAVAIPVLPEGPTEVIQNYNFNADEIGAGLTIYNPTRIQKEREAGIDTHAEPIRLTLRRADTLERKLGQRGYENDLVVPRSVVLSWQGFDKDQAPPDGPIRTPNGVLSFGRASNAAHSGLNDVRLVISTPEGTDEDASVHISRRHFLIYVENDRLMLRVESQNGLAVNGETFRRGESVRLADGDVITPLARQPNAISVTVIFETNQNEAGRIILRRRIGTVRR